MMSEPIVDDDEVLEKSQEKMKTTFSTNQSNVEADTHRVKVEVSNEKTPKVEVQTFECTFDQSFVKRGEERTKFYRLFWARATTYKYNISQSMQSQFDTDK